MKIRLSITILSIFFLLAACTPKSTSSENILLAPVLSEADESIEPTSAQIEKTPTSLATIGEEAASSTPPPSGNVFEVEISGFAFEDNSITIKVGDTINWTNHDSAPHTVVADDGSFESSSLKNDSIFSQTFDNAGTYTYHCGIHLSMTGMVIVEP